MNPAWIDHLDDLRARQLQAYVEEHEQTIRVRERARERRHLLATLVQPDPHEDPDFPGCVW